MLPASGVEVVELPGWRLQQQQEEGEVEEEVVGLQLLEREPLQQV